MLSMSAEQPQVNSLEEVKHHQTQSVSEALSGVQFGMIWVDGERVLIECGPEDLLSNEVELLSDNQVLELYLT